MPHRTNLWFGKGSQALGRQIRQTIPTTVASWNDGDREKQTIQKRKRHQNHAIQHVSRWLIWGISIEANRENLSKGWPRVFAMDVSWPSCRWGNLSIWSRSRDARRVRSFAVFDEVSQATRIWLVLSGEDKLADSACCKGNDRRTRLRKRCIEHAKRWRGAHLQDGQVRDCGWRRSAADRLQTKQREGDCVGRAVEDQEHRSDCLVRGNSLEVDQECGRRGAQRATN